MDKKEIAVITVTLGPPVIGTLLVPWLGYYSFVIGFAILVTGIIGTCIFWEIQKAIKKVGLKVFMRNILIATLITPIAFGVLVLGWVVMVYPVVWIIDGISPNAGFLETIVGIGVAIGGGVLFWNGVAKVGGWIKTKLNRR